MVCKSLPALCGIAIFLLFAGCGNSSNVSQSSGETTTSEAPRSLSIYVENISKESCPKDSVAFVSWNGGNFGRSKSEEDIVFMAKFLREADIISLQEISTSEFGAKTVAKLADELNRTGAKWDYAISPSTYESAAKERFAFLWKAHRIKAVPQKVFLLESLSGKMLREPAKINLRVDGINELTIISLHLAPTEKNPREELLAVSGRTEEFSGGNIILAGDFNLSHKELDPVLKNGLNFQHQINGKTSLKQKADSRGKYLSKEYDNIYTRGDMIICRSSIADFVKKFSDLEKARKISDHLPVFIVFNLV